MSMIGIWRRLSDGYFCNLYDLISISKINAYKDEINFSGQFSKGIQKKTNTIVNTLNLLRKKKFLGNGKKKSLIKIEKDLDQKILLETVKKDKKISSFLEKKSVFKHIIVKNKLINLIVKWNLLYQL